MLLSGLTQIKRRILVTLAHIYPRAVSGKQLTEIIGLSGKAGSLYRGVLKELENEELIFVDQLTPRMYSIRINHEHRLLHHFISICQQHGTPLTDNLSRQINQVTEVGK